MNQLPNQNEVISFLHYYLQDLLQPSVKALYIFADNCSSKNKNNALIQYIYTIINQIHLKNDHSKVSWTWLQFPAMWPLLWFDCAEKIKIERVFLQVTYQEMVEQTNIKKFHVINVNQNFIYNFLEYLKSFF